MQREQDQRIVWKQFKQGGQVPTQRSGHTWTQVGSNFILFGGIVCDREKAVTTNETFSLRIMASEMIWNREKPRGDIPISRAHHGACEIPGDRLLIFGGTYDSSKRFNDTYLLQVGSMTWSQPPNQHSQGEPNNEPSPIGAPEPRSHCTVNYVEGKVYVFGGHGGLYYQRKSFNDIHTLDLNTWEWQKLEVQGQIPEARGGHCSCVINKKLFTFGGWNSSMQYNNSYLFNTETHEWNDIELLYGIPRWNMAAIFVEAIPSNKFFIFGGAQGDFDEGSTRHKGKLSGEVAVLDINTMTLNQVELEDDASGEYAIYVPKPREYGQLVYDKNESRIFMFGGWDGNWIGDLNYLSVSKIVGPPYAVERCSPALGPVTGRTKITLYGIGFSLTSQINVKFICQKQNFIVNAEYVNDTEITCETPNVEAIGPREAEIRVSFKGGAYTITSTSFKYYLNTRAHKSLAYGPGLLKGGLAGKPTVFFIQSRNELGANRDSGNDNYIIKITQGEEEIQHELIDNDTGSYEVRYVAEPGEVKIEVLFVDEKEDVMHIRGSPYCASFDEDAPPKNNEPTGPLMINFVTQSLNDLENFILDTTEGITIKNKNFAEDVKGLLKIKGHTEDVEQKADLILLTMDELTETLAMLDSKDVGRDADARKLKKQQDLWVQLQKSSKETKKDIAGSVAQESDKCKQQIKNFDEELKIYSQNIKKQNYQKYDHGMENSIRDLEREEETLQQHEEYLTELTFLSDHFGFPEAILSCQRQLDQNKADVKLMSQLWNHIRLSLETYSGWLTTLWDEVQSLDWEEDNKKLVKDLREIKVDRKCHAFIGVNNLIKNWTIFLPLVSQLKDPAMKDRHWVKLKKEVKQDFILDQHLKLQRIYDLELHKFSEQVEEIAEQARSEAKMEATLNKIKEIWDVVVYDEEQHKGTDIYLLKMNEDNFDTLEEHQVAVQNMYASRFLAYFEETVNYWQKSLTAIFDITQGLTEVQRLWSFLETLFIHSEEVKKELPEVSRRFVDIDREVKGILIKGKQIKNIKDFATQEDISDRLEDVTKQLNLCEKALHEFLDGKRRAFPRFYFVATNDLLDILSNGNTPSRIMRHMTKVFQAIKEFQLQDGGERPFATQIISSVGKEEVNLSSNIKLIGRVESYLDLCIDGMKDTLWHILQDSLVRYGQQQREEWIPTDPSQITILVNLLDWVTKTEQSFYDMERGNANSLKDYQREEVQQLTNLIRMARTDLSPPVRTKVMCMITMDTHSRDILQQLVDEGVKRADEFQWQSQLKAYWLDMDGKKVCRIRVCDADLAYGYEYLGNGPRLVVTPLTDRIYVTATQALHLKMGCAPAGPAGTGKTETTKDLASAVGKACYVFNCSDQMDYLSMGNIFKGLASSGSWGCFDEFNRLRPEVLSVCSVQFKAVTDAIKRGAQRFILQEDEISLDPSCGAFITMNPGYLGRSELPEGLKTLFRPITVVVPDLELICENMLMAEGFEGAKILARKFTVLYALCKDLLSKQLHYDWGLRAIKSVLVVAGQFKRGEPDLPEDVLLMRALRDFNLPKIVQEDLNIFMGLISDLFPGLDPPPKRDYSFEDVIKSSMAEMQLFDDPEAVLKVVQLRELLEIRHCVFVMGPPGAGKSSTWKLLAKSQDKINQKTTAVDINPKAITADELYGCFAMPSREWKDGLLSKTMRSLGEIADTNPKWLVMDGDIDATWIESMNSVMDDNKILTLASNERIPLLSHMRMLFEIRDLKFASPATVSRAGILYISDTAGYQWRSYYKSWIDARSYDEETKQNLHKLFERYVAKTLKYLKKSVKFVVPVVDINLVASLCNMLQSLLTKEIKALEYWFVFCCIWAIGGSLSEKDGNDYKRNFSNWWKGKFKTIKFPGKGTVFDWYVNYETSRLEDWEKLVDEIQFDSSSQLMNNVTVPTPETVSNSYFIEAFIRLHKPVLLIGNAGCGKTQLCKGILNSLNPEEFCNMIVNFNYYTDANLLQGIMEQPPIEKKTGKQFGPPGKLKLIYFVDDLNMSMLDPYLTQTAIALLRQHQDYGHWYDRNKMTIKEIINSQYLAAMNPTAGSFSVNPRFQRHFWHLSIQFPEANSLFTIYNTFATGHFSKGFKASIQENISFIIKAAIVLHPIMVSSFRKTAVNFHYEFSIRHLANIFQGLLIAQPGQFQEPEKLVRLWIHESERIYGDRLVSHEHLQNYRGIMADLLKKTFAKFNGLQKYFQANSEPLIFCHFANGLVESIYDQVPNIDSLYQILEEALKEYNELNAEMPLVLFEDAMKHVCRISRIVKNPQGHALLVGVGGSGKQSLSRLASHICNYATTQITISQTYGLNELKGDLQIMYQKAGIKDEGVLFLFTEGQITNERFLVYINDLLSSGEISDLYAQEDKDTIVNQIRPAVKGAGIQDTRDNCWNFFIDRIKSNLHMALCFSPIGDNFRHRARKFPAIVNCTVIDWFHDWPIEALTSVAERKLSDVEMPSPEIRQGIIEFMPFSFHIVNKVSVRYKEMEKRYCYTTPKSFLELIKLFISMFDSKRNEIENNKTRLEEGLQKLIETGEVVSQLEEDLQVKQVEVKEKSDAAIAFAEEVGIEKEKVEAENRIALAEAEKCAQIQADVELQQATCKAELDKALPLVEKAQEALNTLQKKDFQMAKAMQKPPPDVQKVGEAVTCLLASIDPGVKTDKQGNPEDKSWTGCTKLMSNPQNFIDGLIAYKGHIDNQAVPAKNFRNVRPYIALENFKGDIIFNKSRAAAGLCEWVRNIVEYYDVVSEVEPKRIALKKAENDLQEANDKLEVINAKVAELQAQLDILIAQYDKAIAEKEGAEAEAAKCELKLDLAQRLVKALYSEKDRWGLGIEEFGEKLKVLIGDVLISSAFVSYVGPFSKLFRDELINEHFKQFILKKGIPSSKNPDPMEVLVNQATIAKWNNQKLPSDPVSIENGVILTNSERWPLIIDPQLQGIAWLREKEKDHNLQVVRLSTKGLINTLSQSIENGYSVILENLEESIDAVLNPVIARNVIRKGKMSLLKLGDKDVIVHANFKLFLHSKMPNPHYPPEIQAEAALINFTVTQDGLEDQLLSLVVKKERADLANQKEFLIQQENEFKIKLKEMEDDVLYRLTNSQGDILEDVELIENLELSKQISDDIKEKMEIAKDTQQAIKKTSEQYRPAAARGALIYFLMNELDKIHTFYMYSLESYLIVIVRAIKKVADKWDAESGQEANHEEEEEKEEQEELQEEEKQVKELSPRSLQKRIGEIIDSITFESYDYVRRGLLETHKLLIVTMLTLRIMVKDGQITSDEYSHFIQGKISTEPGNKHDNLSFLTEQQFAMAKALEQLPQFQGLVNNMESDHLQWRKWFMEEKGESADLPRNFKDVSYFNKLLLLRALRGDRITSGLTIYIRDVLGDRFIDQAPLKMDIVYSESSKQTPIFFVLFPGVDPTIEVEKIGKQHNITDQNQMFVNISMGEGQEENAEHSLDKLGAEGGWVFLQNVHLMQSWLKRLENKLEILAVEGHDNFRCFISSEPPGLPYMKIIPESILQNCIKVANEAPQDLKTNIKRAYSHFDQERLDQCSKQNEFKALLFGLCMFHALVLGRRKFGSQGWSRHYSFNDGDLTICADVLNNYLEKYTQVPYSDLRYLFGAIMYGGHITDHWDRRTCSTYLEVLLRPQILEGMPLAPGFRSPDPSRFDYEAYYKYIDEKLPIESPQMFGMHPNAEINYLTAYGDRIFDTIIDVQGGSGGGQASNVEEIVVGLINNYLEKLPEDFNLLDIRSKTKERPPDIIVCIQECERMNILLSEIRTSLIELHMGLSGALNITEAMEKLQGSLMTNRVPETWETVAYFSKKSLTLWYADLLERVAQLERWSSDLVLPKSLWISGLFNPMSFLTSVMQITARAKGLPLDNMVIQTMVTNVIESEEITHYPENGAYIHGFFLEGAGWEFGRNPTEEGYLTDSVLKDLHPKLPVVNIYAVPYDEQITQGIYKCPVYVTSMRGPTFVFTANLKMDSDMVDQNRWILAGVALLMADD